MESVPIFSSEIYPGFGEVSYYKKRKGLSRDIFGDTIPISELIYPGIFPGEIHEIRKLVLCPRFRTWKSTWLPQRLRKRSSSVSAMSRENLRNRRSGRGTDHPRNFTPASVSVFFQSRSQVGILCVDFPEPVDVHVALLPQAPDFLKKTLVVVERIS